MYQTPETYSSHDALTAWLAAVCAVQSPLAPTALRALVCAMHTDISPAALLALVDSVELAADAAHEARWSLLGGADSVTCDMQRRSIEALPEEQLLVWRSSVETRLAWRIVDGQPIWRASVEDHAEREAAMRAAVASWAPQLAVFGVAG